MQNSTFSLCFLSVVLLCMVMVSCDMDSAETEILHPSKMQIRLIDAPAAYDEVNVEIIDVQLNYTNDAAGWISLENVNTGVYNLLRLTGGVDTLIASGMIKAGSLQHIRLILGTKNSLVVDGKVKPLTTPSAAYSGLKMKVDERIGNGEQYQFTVDFDAHRSIMKAGHTGDYILTPVLRIITGKDKGTIKGVVIANGDRVKVIAHNNAGIYGTSNNGRGVYILKGLPAGNYDLTFEMPGDDKNLTKIIEDVTIKDKNTIKLDTVYLTE